VESARPWGEKEMVTLIIRLADDYGERTSDILHLRTLESGDGHPTLVRRKQTLLDDYAGKPLRRSLAQLTPE